MAMSIVFIVIELRARFDRSFLIFGITNLLLAFFCAIDIWIQPGTIRMDWTRIQHVIAAFFPAFILWYLMALLNRRSSSIIKSMFFIGFCFSLLFFTNIMFRFTEKGIESTIIYNLTFAPYIIVAIIFISIFLIKNLYKCNVNERKVLFFHVVGGIALALSGIIDMLDLFIGHRFLPQISSFTTLGLLLFGLIVTFVFIDRLTQIIRDREVTFGKLQAAYKEMEDVQTLKELGQSTAIINHEIKNYTFVISGYAQYLLDRSGFSEKDKRILTTIADTVKKMADFSNEILNFSKAKILSDKRPVAIFSLIEECVNTHFANKSGSIIIENPDHELVIYGDWSKLEHVFVNIIKNSFEAEATDISIKAIRRDTVLLLVIEDDGVGCTDDGLGNLFKSFYTTKKGKGGTGLGMCVIKSIVESHGGYISAYSKNILDNRTHGLTINIAFPIYNSETIRSLDQKDFVLLIKDGVENLAQVIRIFQNVLVTPYIVQRVDDIDGKIIPLKKSAIYASMNSIDQYKRKYGTQGITHILVKGEKNSVFVVNETKDARINTFSENYILENLY
jgi:signal transduction histidine kinase